ncbi:MAG: hypothetical protein QUV07_13845 [Cyanobium sp. CZS 25K]|nr:hypothetical protein [Cyanobium sp. CZS25K]
MERSNVQVTGADGLEAIMTGEEFAASKNIQNVGGLATNRPLRSDTLVHNISMCRARPEQTGEK